MIKKINIGQIGVGYWGPNILRAIQKSQYFDKIFVSDNSIDRIDFVRKNFKDIIIVENYKELLNNDQISSVVISTPASTHFDLVMMALQNNKNILVEKPIAFNTYQLKKIINLSKKVNKIVMAGHTFLYNNALLKVKELIDQNFIGEVRYIYSQRLNLGKIRSDVDVIWNLAPHDISIIQYLLNDIMPVSISLNAESYIQKNIYDVAFINLKYNNKVMANVHVSWLDPQKSRKVVIVGTKKMLVFDDMIENKIAMYDKGYDSIYASDKIMDYDNPNEIFSERNGEVIYPKFTNSEPLLNEINHFAECMINSKEPRTSSQKSYNITSILSTLSKY